MKEKEEIKNEEKKTVEELKKGNFIDAWVNAFNGIVYAVKTQRNIKWQLLIGVIVIILGFIFDLSKIEFLCLVFTIILVILAEMFNTSIETTVDLYTDHYHPKAKIAKDVAAGGVVMATLNALIVGYVLFFDKIKDLIIQLF